MVERMTLNHVVVGSIPTGGVYIVLLLLIIITKRLLQFLIVLELD